MSVQQLKPVTREGLTYIAQLHFGAGFYEVWDPISRKYGLAVFREDKWNISPSVRDHSAKIVKHVNELMASDAPLARLYKQEVAKVPVAPTEVIIIDEPEEKVKKPKKSIEIRRKHRNDSAEKTKKKRKS